MERRTPQQAGFDFEKRFAAALGVKPVKGSGSQWFALMDIATSSVLLSCKHTDAQSFRVEKGHLNEIQRACSGGQEPALAIDVDGEVYVLQRAGDWLAARTEDATKFIVPNKADMKRATIAVPGLMRGAV